MTQFTVKAPDGQTIIVNGPEGSTQDDAIAYAKTQWKPSKLHQIGETIGDVAKSTGRGLLKAALNPEGIPGDIQSGMTALGDWISDELGQDKSKYAAPKMFPTSQDLYKGVENVTGDLGEAQTLPGHYAESIAEFLPGVITTPETAFVKEIRPGVRAFGTDVMRAMGRTPTGRVSRAANARAPVNIEPEVRRGLGQRLTGAVAAGVGSEAAGELTDDNPFARAVGGGIGGLAAGARDLRATRRERGTRSRNAAELKDEANAGYDQIRSAPQTLDRMAVRLEGSRMLANLEQAGFDPDHIAPKTSGIINKDFVTPVVNRAHPPAGAGATVGSNAGLTAGNILTTYQKLGKILPSEGAEYAAAQIARNDIRTMLQAHPQWANLRDAMGNWAAAEKAEDLENLLNEAWHRAKTTGSGGNFQNVMRQEARKIIDNVNKSRGFSPEELGQLETIVNGDSMENIARLIGKLSPAAGAQSTVFALATGMFTSPSLGLGMAAVGHAAKHFAESRTRRHIEDLGHMIRESAPANRYIAPRLATQSAEAQLRARANLARGIVTGAQSNTGNDLEDTLNGAGAP